jgi:hypothetical protein
MSLCWDYAGSIIDMAQQTSDIHAKSGRGSRYLNVYAWEGTMSDKANACLALNIEPNLLESEKG